MITAMAKTAKRLDWGAWFLGIMSSVIAAGSGAASGVFGTVILDSKDPDHYATTPGHLFYLGLMCFAFSGVTALFTYLHNHPVPDAEPAVASDTKQ